MLHMAIELTLKKNINICNNINMSILHEVLMTSIRDKITVSVFFPNWNFASMFSYIIIDM